jgi:hypothetical protein
MAGARRRCEALSEGEQEAYAIFSRLCLLRTEIAKNPTNDRCRHRHQSMETND